MFRHCRKKLVVSVSDMDGGVVSTSTAGRWILLELVVGVLENVGVNSISLQREDGTTYTEIWSRELRVKEENSKVVRVETFYGLVVDNYNYVGETTDLKVLLDSILLDFVPITWEKIVKRLAKTEEQVIIRREMNLRLNRKTRNEKRKILTVIKRCENSPNWYPQKVGSEVLGNLKETKRFDH